VRSLCVCVWGLLIVMLPQLSWAESQPTCPAHCAIYESYCLGPDSGIQSESECPDTPPEQTGVEREVIACEFSLGDSTVEGTCGWSLLAHYDSDDCPYSSLPVDPSPCAAVDADGVTVSGVCEGGCAFPSTGSAGVSTVDDAAAGCQAAGLNPALMVGLLWGFYARRRRV